MIGKIICLHRKVPVTVEDRKSTEARLVLVERDVGNEPVVGDMNRLWEPSLKGECQDAVDVLLKDDIQIPRSEE